MKVKGTKQNSQTLPESHGSKVIPQPRAPKAKDKGTDGGCSGSMIYGNTWFNIGLNKTEARALKRVAARILVPRYRKSASAARILIQTALAHYDVLEALIFSDARYCKDEGFSCYDDYLEGIIRRVHEQPAKKTRRAA